MSFAHPRFIPPSSSPALRLSPWWGEFLQAAFDPSKVRIENHAKNGRSTRTFITEGLWQNIMTRARPGDYVRRKFKDSTFVDTHGEYPDIVRSVATAEKVPLIDMHRRSEAVLKAYGPDSSRTLFLQLKPGENPNYPKGIEDNTHFNPTGAQIMTRLSVDGLRDLKIGLTQRLLPPKPLPPSQP